MSRSLVVLAVALAVAPRPAIAQSRFSVGVLGGFAFEQPFFDYTPSHVQFAIAEVNLAGALITSDGKPTVEAITGLIVAQSLRPGSRFITGVSETFRVHLRPRGRFSTYVEAGAGEVSSALFTHIVETEGYFQYLLQAGVGVRWRTERDTFTLGYRGIHFSNHDTLPSNQGLNNHGFVVSYARTLKTN